MTYEAWRCTYQSSEQAARAAYEQAQELQRQNAALKLEAQNAKQLVEAVGAGGVERLRKCPGLHQIQEPSQLEAAQQGVPEGWALVPVEPQDAQQAAGATAIRFDTTLINKMWTANKVYREMVAAAPQPPEAETRRQIWMQACEQAAREEIAPVQLPAPDINTANHVGLRVIGYTPEAVRQLLADQGAHHGQ
ncbi:MAG: hypothetical protein ACI4QS_10960 [Comamonas sp.]